MHLRATTVQGCTWRLHVRILDENSSFYCLSSGPLPPPLPYSLPLIFARGHAARLDVTNEQIISLPSGCHGIAPLLHLLHAHSRPAHAKLRQKFNTCHGRPPPPTAISQSLLLTPLLPLLPTRRIVAVPPAPTAWPTTRPMIVTHLVLRTVVTGTNVAVGSERARRVVGGWEYRASGKQRTVVGMATGQILAKV